MIEIEPVVDEFLTITIAGFECNPDFGDGSFCDTSPNYESCCTGIDGEYIVADGSFEGDLCFYHFTNPSVCSLFGLFDRSMVGTAYYGAGPCWEVKVELYLQDPPFFPNQLLMTWIYRSDPFDLVVGDPTNYESRGTFTLNLVSTTINNDVDPEHDPWCLAPPTIDLETAEPPAT